MLARMLTSFGVKSFKSFVEAKLPLAPLTVLIGTNASGKSNLLEAMQLLSWMARATPPHRSRSRAAEGACQSAGAFRTGSRRARRRSSFRHDSKKQRRSILSA